MPTILYRKVHCSSDSDTIGYLLKLEFYFSVGKFYNGVVFQCIGTFLNAQSVNNARLVSATEKFSLGLKVPNLEKYFTNLLPRMHIDIFIYTTISIV